MSKEQMRPASPDQAPDPANTYERAKPERESQGKMDAPKTPPANSADKMDQSVPHQQNTSHQLNSEEQQSGQAARDNTPQATQPAQGQPGASGATSAATSAQPDHSMNDEPETGWDTAPNDINDARDKRHPRTGGKGGTPDVGQKPENS